MKNEQNETETRDRVLVLELWHLPMFFFFIPTEKEARQAQKNAQRNTYQETGSAAAMFSPMLCYERCGFVCSGFFF